MAAHHLRSAPLASDSMAIRGPCQNFGKGTRKEAGHQHGRTLTRESHHLGNGWPRESVADICKTLVRLRLWAKGAVSALAPCSDQVEKGTTPTAE